MLIPAIIIHVDIDENKWDNPNIEKNADIAAMNNDENKVKNIKNILVFINFCHFLIGPSHH